MASRAFVRAITVALLVSALAGCASFSGKPALPKHASIERAASPAATTDYHAVVQDADVIYFPQERAASGGKSEPAALLLEALQGSGKSFAIAWDLIDAAQQPLLDELQARVGTAREELVAKLDLSGSGRAREHCRAVLRDSRLPGVHFVALRFPQALAEKMAAGARLNSDEQPFLPAGFTLPPGGLDAYAERLSATGGLNNRNVVGAYRVEILRRQFAAETIVRYFRSAGSDAKLVVFSNSSDFADDQGVPFYVAQKMQLRQLVLGRDAPQPSRTQLLTRLSRDLRRSFQVVDRTPRPARD